MIEDIKLPPLPKDEIGNRNDFVSNDRLMLVEAAQDYAHAAVESYRQQLGEPVAWVRPEHIKRLRHWKGVVNAKNVTLYYDQGEREGLIPLYPSPQPAAPAQEPSKLSNAEIMSLAYDVGAMPEQMTDESLLRFARALLTRYGRKS